ncbi:uncharacterized protein LOC662568 [Tribolium castaneum]
MFNIVSILIILQLLSITSAQFLRYQALSREKRTLIWPKGTGVVQAIAGFGIPVHLKEETVIVGTVFKATYHVPENVTELKAPYVTYERRKRSATRWDIYNLLSQAFEMRGFDGKACILRAICEVAHTPLQKNYGFFHELIHTIFTPSSTNERVKLNADNEYYAAQLIGEERGNCGKVFHDCGTSLLDMITIYGNVLPPATLPDKMIKCKTLFLAFFLSLAANGQDSLSREKRTLIWPQGGSKLLAIFGIGIPVDLKTETVIVGMVIKANYRYPTNLTELRQPFVTFQRKKRGASRWDLYALLTQALEMRGFGGKSCLLRTICEVARTPLEKNFGLFAELIHTFFTPTATNERVSHHRDNEYYAAQVLGEKGLNCGRIFKECDTNLADLFTVPDYFN